MDAQFEIEVARGERFEFGANWRRFLKTLNDARIAAAELSLRQMLELENLEGMRFLDVGCGSGLFSLAARRLGAAVHSFDFDPQSVACAVELKRRFFPDDQNWTIAQGSALDEPYLNSLGAFDVVYSWGVLHHTGNLRLALANARIPVKPGGLLFIAIYNDQGMASKFWTLVKKIHCSGAAGRLLIRLLFIPWFFLQSVAAGLVKSRNPLRRFRDYKQKRGMSIYHDWLDWLGGYPFEVAKPEDVFRYYRDHGFTLKNLVTTNRLGCNQFVFQKRH